MDRPRPGSPAPGNRERTARIKSCADPFADLVRNRGCLTGRANPPNQVHGKARTATDVQLTDIQAYNTVKLDNSMSPRELVKTALRVLAAWTAGPKPASADLGLLRQAFPSSANLPDDELACQVIRDLGGRAFRKPAQVETAPLVKDEVA